MPIAMPITNLAQLAILLSSVAFATTVAQRPFFNIGHQVNSISLIETFLELGSNVLEIDVRFDDDGSAKELFHGFPCDAGRDCYDSEDVDHYLDMIKELTDPGTKNGYYEKLVMLFFDLKLVMSGNKTNSGVDMARRILGHLWTRDGSREQEMRVLLYIQNRNDIDFIRGFVAELTRLGQKHRLRDVGFDGGVGDLDATRKMFENLDLSANVWMGDGITNVLRPFRGDARLKQVLSKRDAKNGFVRKVYDWTVDKKPLLRKSLKLGVDGVITNQPEMVLEVLREAEFGEIYRLATLDDDPFVRYEVPTD